ncbi:MAG TPA: hypothetical protein VGS41_00975 [Chthonomonadales bacterium]|nr:hypothetical protein [Chthonomonadales bacterium]
MRAPPGPGVTMDFFDLACLLWYFLKGGDWFALLVSGGLGYLAGHYVPQGWPSILTTMLVSYHLFLIWLLLTSDKDLEAMSSLGYAASIHLACMVVIVALGSGRLLVPHFDLVCAGIAVLAFFERSWIFEPRQAAIPEAEEPVASSAQEYREWLAHVAEESPQDAALHGSRKQEFEEWLRARRRGDTA